MALYLNIKVGQCLKVGDAEIFLVENLSRTKCRVQIEADKDSVPVTLVGEDGVDQIWDGPPIFQTKSTT